MSSTEAARWSPRALGSGIPRVCLSRQPEGGERALESGRPRCHVTSGPALGLAVPTGGQGDEGMPGPPCSQHGAGHPERFRGCSPGPPGGVTWEWFSLELAQEMVAVSTASWGPAGTSVTVTAVAGVGMVTGDWTVRWRMG